MTWLEGRIEKNLKKERMSKKSKRGRNQSTTITVKTSDQCELKRELYTKKSNVIYKYLLEINFLNIL